MYDKFLMNAFTVVANPNLNDVKMTSKIMTFLIKKCSNFINYSLFNINDTTVLLLDICFYFDVLPIIILKTCDSM